ncbi:MAG TPA: CheR family methyltransferase [Gemmatimonadales bacterium]|nr:CheR family methyltransferase [Gemmatimonadales bacterium]
MNDPTASEDLADGERGTAEPLLSSDDPEWATLLTYLVMARGFDFHGYKPTTLARRIRKRMEALDIDSFAAYQDHLEVHPDEFATLFNTILINVTGFFRDPQAWDVIRSEVVPRIVSSKAPGEPIRAWSAGCASGEEAYTIAMVLAEKLGADQFLERVKIYATDVDEDALNAARRAAYTTRQVEPVPPELLDRYFDRLDGMYVFRKDFRRQVIFGRHDLLADAPISRVDLLACRNTLMYFNSEVQARILSRLHFALNDGGFLFLGRAEMLTARAQTFQPLDLKRRISQKVSRGHPEQPTSGGDGAPEGERWFRLPEVGLEASPVPQLLVDPSGTVVSINEQARALFGLRPSDVGRLLRDLQLSYRPADLRSLIDQATAERRPIAVKEVEWRAQSGESRWLDVQVAPLGDPIGDEVGTLIAYTDVTGYHRLTRELEQSHQELETAYEELQSTNEELETTNEELQSTVEELETTNEELQSTNEELETMNEELQSTNEELQTINDELRQRGDELNAANAFLQSVMTSLRGGVAVVDRELRLLAWSRHAEELWGLRLGEVSGQHLLNLDIGLPVERLRPALKACLSGDSAIEQVVLDAVNRRGKTIRCTVTCTPLMGGKNEVRGVILLMEEIPPGS